MVGGVLLNSGPDGSVSVSGALAAAGVPWSLVPFTREGWDGCMGDGVLKSVFGAEVVVSPEMVELPDAGVSLLGLLRPTVEAASYVTRAGGAVSFHKAVLGPDGGVRGYATVSLVDGRVRVGVSEHPVGLDNLGPAAVVADIDDGEWATFKCLSSVVAPSTAGLVGGGDPLSVMVADFDLAAALMGWGGDFFKSEHGPIPDGARWITVHPNGEGTKGVPVLVQPAKDNSGTYHVIGGAGGKLNMLRLRGVKSEGEYKKEHAERAAAKREAAKEKVRRDKELGLHDAKVEARKQIALQKRAAQTDFIETVAEAMGWKKEDMALDTSGLSPEAAKKAEAKHRADLLKKAKAAVNTQKQALVADAEKHGELGDVSLDAGVDGLSVDDLDPVHIPDTSGISHGFKARAEDAGLTPEKLDEVVTAVQVEAGLASADPAKAAEKGEVAAKIREELAKVPKPQLQVKIAEAKKAIDLIKAQKKLAEVEKLARAAAKAVDNSLVEPKAYVLVASDVTDDAVVQSIEDDLRTARAKAFLAGVDEAGGADALESHLTAGAFNAFNGISQAVGGASLLDRSVVDVLGVAGAAQVLARRLHSGLPEQAVDILSGLEDYHVAHAPALQEKALAEAKELQDMAAEIELGEAGAAGDLLAASALNRQRKQHLADARKVIGQALGEMEANASLVAALRDKPRSFVQVSLGATALDTAVKQLWAIGLTDADFKIDRVAGNVFATVHASGLDKLAGTIDKENLDRVSRNLAIMKGAHDEEQWLPDGFAKRPDLGLNLPAGVAPGLAAPMDWDNPDKAQALRDYIGSRMADGDPPADILSDIQSAPFFAKAGDQKAYRAALDAVVPTKNGKKMIRVEQLAPVFDQYADDYVAAKWGGARSTLNRQKFEPDAVAQDALHRALADEPAGVVAYKPIGELDRKDREALKAFFFAHVAQESPEQKELRMAAEALQAQEPERYETDMFGEQAENPAWQVWKGETDAAVAAANAAGLDWPRYVKMMNGKVRAFEAIQDMVRSRVSEKFAQTYNTLRPDAPLKIGRTLVRHNLNHLGAIDPAEREKRLKMERELIDSLRARIKGKYASGSVADKLDEAKEQQAAFEQAQMGFFASDDMFGGGDAAPAKPLGADERHTIGHAAEHMIGKMMGVVGRNFEPGKPVKLFKPSMSGPDGAKRQRMVKLIAENKRVIAAAGVGSGKTAIGLGAFAHLHAAGKVKKGLFVVPSIVQGQFGAEALRFLEAGRFNWHCEPGDSYEDRLAAYKDPESHFAVVTHQSFRDDVLKMAVEAGKGATPEAVSAAMAGMDKEGRAAFTKDVLAHHGIGWDYVMADEGHGLLNREGKENSGMSNVIEGVTDGSEYYVHASGDPVKNDASEAFSLLQKMDGARYKDRAAFMRRYGGDTRAAKEGLQRELARHLYAMSVNPDVQVTRSEVKVPQSEAQNEALKAVEGHVAALRIAKMSGGVDVAAAKALAPAMFEGVPDEEHEAVARTVGDTVGILKRAAVRRVLDNHPAAGKLDHVAKLALERKGKQGVVFARSLDAVDAIRARLEKDGHRVVTISGRDSAKDKADKIRKFNPDKGDPEADIIVCSDAGATGANLQSGRWLVQYDTSDTAMVHAQRQGRINRIGQKNPVELIDMVADHEQERRARSRLANKYDLRDLLTSPLEGMDDTGLALYLKQKGTGEAHTTDSLF